MFTCLITKKPKIIAVNTSGNFLDPKVKPHRTSLNSSCTFLTKIWTFFYWLLTENGPCWGQCLFTSSHTSLGVLTKVLGRNPNAGMEIGLDEVMNGQKDIVQLCDSNRDKYYLDRGLTLTINRVLLPASQLCDSNRDKYYLDRGLTLTINRVLLPASRPCDSNKDKDYLDRGLTLTINRVLLPASRPCDINRDKDDLDRELTQQRQRLFGQRVDPNVNRVLLPASRPCDSNGRDAFTTNSDMLAQRAVNQNSSHTNSSGRYIFSPVVSN
ncbi:hypothetical protein J6590_076002 [Homalodisca vitripennis]|nr:hypothetical protein J6590_076002 [Homalodisca vitripennis]